MSGKRAWRTIKPETAFAIVFRDGTLRGMTQAELFPTRAAAGCKLQSLLPSPAKRIAKVRITEVKP